jgi:ADP-heptose:LPS heptosyltransferase/glycosyltransferase involved in cell wall biosynthesis
MKIMQILPRMNIGGVERGVVDLTKFNKEKEGGGGQAIENIVVSAGGRLVDELTAKGVIHYKLAVHRKSLFSLLLVPRLRKIIEEEKIDIIHARSRVPAWISFFASRGSRAHFVTTAHGVYKNRFFSEVMGWGKFVICPSKVVARHMKNNFGVSDEKIIIIERWVDLNRFKFSDYQKRKENNVIVSVGRISATKGYEHLIKGFKKIVRFNPYLKLKIVGSADRSKAKYLNYLKTLVSRYSLNYNVEFLGFVPDVEKILTEARILVAPSVIEESFGRVIVEAFACGVPVIATKVGGFQEIVEDKKDGLLVEPHSPESISDAILTLLKDSDLANRLVKRAREKVEALYTMPRCLEATGQVYKKTLKTLNILVIKISSLGDLILAFPSLKAIRQEFPKAKISLLTSKKYHSLIYDCPYVDEIIALDDRYKNLKDTLRIAKILRRKSFDYIVDLQNSKTSHIISFLSFARYSFGFGLRWGFLLAKKIKYDRSLGPLDSQETILELLGLRLKEKKLIFWEKKDLTAASLPAGNLIGINISASQRWQSKNWPLKNIIRLTELIHKNLPNFKVILFGDKGSVNQASEIEKATVPHPFNLCGKTALGDLAQLMKQLKVFISPDTATLHLASAVGTPVIALFGPTDPTRHTIRDKDLFVFCEQLPCSFCYRPKCKLKEGNVCLEKITPQQVFAKIKDIVKEE